MADELVDIYDISMNHLGTAMKTQAHKEGLWHKAFHCWIVKKDPQGNHKVWLQMRGHNKDLWPDLLDISAAGHLKAGETAKDGIREIQEELGLTVGFDKLTKLFTYTQAVDLNDNYHNREFNPTYVFETDKTLEDITMQPEEVDGAYEVSIADILELVNGNVKEIKISGLKRNEDNTYTKEERVVTLDNFVPHGIRYYLKLMETLNRFCNNQGLEN